MRARSPVRLAAIPDAAFPVAFAALMGRAFEESRARGCDSDRRRAPLPRLACRRRSRSRRRGSVPPELSRDAVPPTSCGRTCGFSPVRRWPHAADGPATKASAPNHGMMAEDWSQLAKRVLLRRPAGVERAPRVARPCPPTRGYSQRARAARVRAGNRLQIDRVDALLLNSGCTRVVPMM